MNKLGRGMLLAAVIAAVSITVIKGCEPKVEKTVETEVVYTVAIKPQVQLMREDILPEKTREDRVALRAAASRSSAVPEQQPVQSTAAEPVFESETTPPPEVPASAAPPTTNAEPAPPAAPPEPAPAPSYSDNGWQPTAAEHDHGTGADSGVCPACGLLYGPAGGVQGQYTAQDGLMD